MTEYVPVTDYVSETLYVVIVIDYRRTEECANGIIYEYVRVTEYVPLTHFAGDIMCRWHILQVTVCANYRVCASEVFECRSICKVFKHHLL